jgi:hypothetical protein
MPFMRRHCRGNPAELLFAVAYLEEEATALCEKRKKLKSDENDFSRRHEI